MDPFGLLVTAIALGLVVSLLLGELCGLTVGGMVVPGYVALYMGFPEVVGLTIGAAWLTYASVRLLGSVMVVYGRRRTVVTILIGFLLGSLIDFVVVSRFAELSAELGMSHDLATVGFIIPGLIAIWIDRQGLFDTSAGLLVSAAVTRLLLVCVVPEALHSHDLMQSVPPIP